MAKLQVFTLENLALYDELIKDYVDTESAKSLKTVAIDGNTLKFYRVSEPVGETEPVYEITLPNADISGLLAKLTTTTAGNVVVTKADGTIEDSGIALTDLATDTELKAVSDLVGVIPNGYDATTIAEYAKELADNVSANGYDDTALQTAVAGKADKATTLEGYGITDAYTKTEVDTAIANAEHLKRTIVDALPDIANADTHTIYMVKKTNGSGEQQYDEYMLINGVFEKIGDSTVDLTNYATKEYVDDLNTDMNARVTALENLIGEGYTEIVESDIRALFTT